MDAWKRDRLYGEIRRRLAERRDGRVRRTGERSCTLPAGAITLMLAVDQWTMFRNMCGMTCRSQG